METIEKTFAANITYSGFTYNTRLLVEYEHTGEYYFLKTRKGIHVLADIDDAKDYQLKGKQIYKSSGYYFIKRLAIPTINAKGERDIWYINNAGDFYSVNKVSKYAKRIHADMSKETRNKITL